MMRKLVAALLIVVAGALVLHSATSTGLGQDKGKKAKKKAAPYVHTVIFYLKKDAPKNAVSSAIQDSHKLLGKIPTVRQLRVGRPAKKATPDFAKTDYDLGLMILFDDYAGLETYLKHDLHLQFVAKYEKMFDRVLVYDFSNQKK